MKTGNASAPGRIRYSMLAMGERRPPASIALGQTTYTLVQIVKHDFWALSAFYDDAAGRRVVLKASRTQDFHGLRMAGIGRWLCRREVRFYRALGDLPNVPQILGLIGQSSFLHAYVPGRPLNKNAPVPDGFFAQLQALLSEIHRRRIAYIDMNKCPNILLGDDGRPHLIDFQISGDLHEWGDWFLTRWLLRRLQREDWYHLLKHKRRLRPDELTEAERAAVQQRSVLIRAHRLMTKPYFLIRRATYRRLRQTGWIVPESIG